MGAVRWGMRDCKTGDPRAMNQRSPSRAGLLISGLGVIFLLIALVAGRSSAGAAVDEDLFVDEFVASVPAQSLAAEWLPDGRLLILARDGVVSVTDLSGASQQVLQMSNVSTAGERGALDLALHPNFATNNQFFVYHATDEVQAKLRIVRYTLDETSASATKNSRVQIWENPGPDHTTNFHIGGSLEVSNDNKLLLTIGDGFRAADSALLDRVFGKVIRLNLDGSIPSDNPFVGTSGALDEIYAHGLRNPFRSWVDPLTGEHWVGDVGGNNATRAYEEINLIEPGASYGWPACEGPLGAPKNGPICPSGTTGPWHYYAHDVNDSCCSNRSITLGERYRGNAMPAEMQNAFIFGDWADRTLHWVEAETDGTAGAVHNIPIAGNSRPIWISVGPDDGYIYFLNFPFSTSFELRRIRYTGTTANPPSIQSVQATPLTGPSPLDVTFSAVVNDPDGDPINYLWQFGDGTTSAAPSPTHTYTTVGNYQAQLTITANGDSASSSLINVQVGAAPEVEIVSPIDGSSFEAGDVLTLDALAVDPGGDPNVSYEWSVELLHEDHSHPVFSGDTRQTLPFEIARTGHDYRGETGYLITVTATNSDGVSSTESVTVYPSKVDLTIDNNLGSGTVLVDGRTHVVPFVLDTAVGFEHEIEAVNPLCVENVESSFVSWSDGGARSHAITTPGTDANLTASYAPGPQCRPCGSDWEAELGTEVVPGFQIGIDGTASGSGFLYVPDGTLGNRLTAPDGSTTVYEYCVDAPVDGTYVLEGRVASADLVDQGNSFWLQVDEGPWQPWHFTDSLDWNVQQASNQGSVRYEWQLDSGVHVVRIGFREDGARIDSFSVAPLCAGEVATVNLGAGDLPTEGDDIIVGTQGPDVIDGLGGDDTICGEGGDDTILGGDGDDTIFGGDGDDTVLGNAGDDTISGGDGGDLIAGNADNDVIDGEDGNDTVFGGSGDDAISGGLGDDVLGGSSGRDVISGDDGNDRITGGSGDDGLISGGDGGDAVNGGGGNDTNVHGDAGNDTVSGNGGSDTIFGGDGNDQVRGGQGDDIVNGGTGDDFVAGNAGNDTCDGGTGGETAGDTAATNCETLIGIP